MSEYAIVAPEDFDQSVFRLIGKEWMLVTAKNQDIREDLSILVSLTIFRKFALPLNLLGLLISSIFLHSSSVSQPVRSDCRWLLFLTYMSAFHKNPPLHESVFQYMQHEPWNNQVLWYSPQSLSLWKRW